MSFLSYKALRLTHTHNWYLLSEAFVKDSDEKTNKVDRLEEKTWPRDGRNARSLTSSIQRNSHAHENAVTQRRQILILQALQDNLSENGLVSELDFEIFTFGTIRPCFLKLEQVQNTFAFDDFLQYFDDTSRNFYYLILVQAGRTDYIRSSCTKNVEEGPRTSVKHRAGRRGLVLIELKAKINEALLVHELFSATPVGVDGVEVVCERIRLSDCWCFRPMRVCAQMTPSPSNQGPLTASATLICGTARKRSQRESTSDVKPKHIRQCASCPNRRPTRDAAHEST